MKAAPSTKETAGQGPAPRAAERHAQQIITEMKWWHTYPGSSRGNISLSPMADQ